MDNGFSEWGGYMEAKITKLEEQYAKSSHQFRKTNLFNGISIFVNGLTDPSADELKRIMMEHGGTYHHYQRSHTSFIIASNLPNVKILNMNTSKVISPQWVVDCLKENRILDYTKYLLYTNHKKSQPKINFKRLKLKESQKPTARNEENVEIKKFNGNSTIISNIEKSLNVLNEKIFKSPEKVEENNGNRLSPDLFEGEDDDLEFFKASEKIEKSIVDEKLFQNSTVKVVQQPTTSKPSTTNFGVARTAVDPKFLSEFYNNSRLHHIATLGAGFKQYISELRENHTDEFPKRDILREKLTKNPNFIKVKSIIMHIDMDCFFVSVGLRSHPELRGQPIAVTHSKGAATGVRPGVDRQLEMNLYMKRLQEKLHDNVVDGNKAEKVRSFEHNDSLSEIASCSYEARKMGVKNGMFVGQALKLCPQLKTIQYDFGGYKEVAFTLYDTIAQYTLNIEAVSCDEMFVDLTDLLNDIQVDTMKFVEFIRNEVKSKTGCPCSAGIGENRLQARMATKKAKPDGQFHLHPENVEEYMKSISISDLPGVGYSTAHSLNKLGCKTCGDLQNFSLSKLQSEIGKKFGETLYQFCRGIDSRPLTYGQIRKSVSAEVNYGIRFKEYSELENFLQQLCEEVHSRLQKIKRKGKCITLKVMIRAKDAPIETAKFMGHGFCDYQNKSISLPDYTDSLDVITKNVLSIMKSLNLPPKELRGIGIQISKLNIPNNYQETMKKENDIKTLFSKAIQKQTASSNCNSNIIEKVNSVSINTNSKSVTSKQEIAVQVDLPKPRIETVVKVDPPKTTVDLPKTTVDPPKPKVDPPKSITKSPNKTKKTIGRPPKIKPKEKTIQSCNIMNMLQKVPSKRPHSLTEEIDSDIDLEVLAELPEEIKQEVLRDYTKVRKVSNTKKEIVTTTTPNKKEPEKTTSPTKGKIHVDAEFLDILPSQLRKEVEKEISLQDDKIVVMRNESNDENRLNANDNDDDQIASTSKIETNSISKQNDKISEDNIFIQEHCEELIKGWVDSSNVPEEYDVQILSNHACELIEAKKIHELYDPLVFLKGVINEKNYCEWHKAYRSIIDKIQLKMIEIYEAYLLLDDKIDCDKCNLKS